MNKRTKGEKIIAACKFVIILYILLNCFELSLTDDTESVVRVQLHEFYNAEEIDTLVLGVSPAIRAFDIRLMEDNREEHVFSLATSNQIAIGGYYLLKEAIARYEIDTVIYHTSKARFWETDVENAYNV